MTGLAAGDRCLVDLPGTEIEKRGIIVEYNNDAAIVQLDTLPAGDHRRFPISQVHVLPNGPTPPVPASEDGGPSNDPFDDLVQVTRRVLDKLDSSVGRHQRTLQVRRSQVVRVRKALRALAGGTSEATEAQTAARLANAAKARDTKARKAKGRRPACPDCGHDIRSNKHREQCKGWVPPA